MFYLDLELRRCRNLLYELNSFQLTILVTWIITKEQKKKNKNKIYALTDNM